MSSKEEKTEKDPNIVVRFAPSPTGMLHIGGARTALFNYLYARHNGGKLLLRIEDTDTARNSQEAIDEIIRGLDWLGIDHDGDIVMQSSRYNRHLEVAKQMVEDGVAYYAYDTEEEIAEKKAECEKKGVYYRYDGSRWKDGKTPIPEGVKPVIRLKVPEGKIKFHDLIRGDIEFDNSTLDDFVLVRSNGTPTYMLAVVVDDHDMGITHVIRGDDHIANTPKQILIYRAMGAQEPKFAHIPLIYDIQGKKLSKRKHAVAVSDYQNEGYLPEAIFNYLLHLGWNDGTEKEIYTKQEAIDAFEISRCGRSPSRFDFEKLKNINLYYVQQRSDENILEMVLPQLKNLVNREIKETEKSRLMAIMDELKKYRTINEIAGVAVQFLDDAKIIDKELLEDKEKIAYLKNMIENRIDFADFNNSFKEELKKDDKKMKDYYPTLRTMLIGVQHGVGVNAIVNAFGKDAILEKIKKY